MTYERNLLLTQITNNKKASFEAFLFHFKIMPQNVLQSAPLYEAQGLYNPHLDE